MGSAHSQEDLEICESDEEEELVDDRVKSPSSSLDEVESKLRALKLKYPSTEQAEAADDSMWEEADDILLKSPQSATPQEEEEAASEEEGIHSLALGALDNSFLVGDSGIQVFKNMRQGVQGTGVCVNFEEAAAYGSAAPKKKPLLMRAETNMLLMSQNPGGIHQLDIETGKVISEWKFEKDGVDISMSDITNDGSCYCQSPPPPVLTWAQGHQFSRGTRFSCFATTGDGSIVAGSFDGQIRLYSRDTLNKAKTAFPGLGAPLTHVDATYDGKWIVGTTDTYLIVISTLFTDKAGKTKTGFEGPMGNNMAAPRLLNLTPLHAHLAGSNNKFRNAQFSWSCLCIDFSLFSLERVGVFCSGMLLCRSCIFCPTVFKLQVTEDGKQERHVVATVGKFSVIWNFQQVKDGSHECYREQEGLKKCYCYKIVLRNESIVDSRFMNDNFAVSGSPEAPLVIATPMKVSSFSLSSKRGSKQVTDH
ncbi:hypothetical protein Bca4012_086000 [Brassica carinata]